MIQYLFLGILFMDSFATSARPSRLPADYDDDDWDIPAGVINANYNTPVYFPRDPCRLLCEEFSASNRGNGYNLCDEAPGTSFCIYDASAGQEICSHIYWSVTEDQEPGLVYEVVNNQTTATALVDLRPVTCREAEDIVFGPAQPNTTVPLPPRPIFPRTSTASRGNRNRCTRAPRRGRDR